MSALAKLSILSMDTLCDYPTLSTKVSNSLSAHYLQETVTAMDKICRRIGKAHNFIIIGLSALFLMSLLLIKVNVHLFEGLFLLALVGIVSGWIKWLSINVHLFVIGGIPLIKFARACGITYLKWHGWKLETQIQ